jgi:putative hydrolase of the HAD superfamily
MADLSNVRGIIWDLDDTLYSVKEPLHQSMRESIARSVVDMGHPISYEDALKMAEESQEKYRMTVKLRVDKFEIGHEELHLPFHANMDHEVTDVCADLPEMFQQGHRIGLQHVIMTHASKDWALRMLDRMGIADFFPANHIYGLEDIDFQKKEDSDRATKTGLDVMGVDAQHGLFAEDRDWNLTIPHELGLTTVLIDHPSQPRDLPGHVHHRFDRAADLMTEIIAAQSLQKTGS